MSKKPVLVFNYRLAAEEGISFEKLREKLFW